MRQSLRENSEAARDNMQGISNALKAFAYIFHWATYLFNSFIVIEQKVYI